MTSTLPYSLWKGLQISAALTAAALIGLTPSSASAKMPNIKRQSNVNITFELLPPDTTSIASGVAKIEIEHEKKSTKTELEVEVAGLTPGLYSVEATLSDTTTIELGEIEVTATTAPETTTATDEGEGSLAGTLAASVDAAEITTITVSTIPADEITAPVVVLSGTPETQVNDLNYFANVRVTAPPVSALTTTPTPTDDTEVEFE
ncbi:MAG: hypothetical protein EOP84_08850, partial [Verrucomicrobiaceae bacterium]